MEVRGLHIDVFVRNEMPNRTFVFPRRELVLDFTGHYPDPDGLHGADPPHSYYVVNVDDPYELTPGEMFTASYDVPIAKDGSYGWHVVTWYYEN